jgi:hypothetical protein
VYCNAQHLQIHECAAGEEGLSIEWVGERRSNGAGRDVVGISCGAVSGN